MKLFYKFFFAVIAVIILNAAGNFDAAGRNIVIRTDTTISPAGDSLLVLEEQKLKMAEGKKMYEARCQKCHVLYQPGQFRIKKWVKNLEEMKNKAELKPEEYELILQYLSANSKK